jgi:hypothetical protein
MLAGPSIVTCELILIFYWSTDPSKSIVGGYIFYVGLLLQKKNKIRSNLERKRLSGNGPKFVILIAIKSPKKNRS